MGHNAFFRLTTLLLMPILSVVVADIARDKQALLDFLHNIPHSQSLNWNSDSSVCQTWIGVTCNHDHSRVIALRLPGQGLTGPIPPNTLSRLSAIQVLSLRLNGLSGPFPSDFLKLGNLTGLYLQSNDFSGLLPSDFSVLKSLEALDLSSNKFTGQIPYTMSNLTHLTTLDLANNSFSGEIPEIDIPSLQHLNLANNHLTGSIPGFLKRFPSSVFLGNNLSSNGSIPPPPPEPTNAHRPKKTTKLGEPALLGMILGACILAFVATAALMIVYYSNKGNRAKSLGIPRDKLICPKENQEQDNQVVSFEGLNCAFDLEDLLRASAEVLGKGTYGTTYKAALEDSSVVVVKRLKDINVSTKEFQQFVELIGHIRHDNVVALRGYYCSKEKLLIYDYCSQGSVSLMLHGNLRERRTSLDWETRLKIVIGAVKGTAYVHSQNGGKLVHGNLTTSNIFMNSQGYGCVSEIGLATILSSVPPGSLRRNAGYRAPELTDNRKVSQASDVYSLGVILLEILTGKEPIHSTSGNNVIHLVRWVQSVVREEWTAEVFDVQLWRYPNIEEEMVEMLKIGMDCVASVPEQRPTALEVLNMVENIRRSHNGDNSLSEIKSGGTTPALTPPAASEVAISSAS